MLRSLFSIYYFSLLTTRFTVHFLLLTPHSGLHSSLQADSLLFTFSFQYLMSDKWANHSLFISRSSRLILRSSLFTFQFFLLTVHSSLLINLHLTDTHSSLLNLHWSLSNTFIPLLSPHSSLSFFPHSSLLIYHNSIFTSHLLLLHCLFHTVSSHSSLLISPLLTSHFTGYFLKLHASYCPFRTANFLLLTLHCLISLLVLLSSLYSLFTTHSSLLISQPESLTSHSSLLNND